MVLSQDGRFELQNSPPFLEESSSLWLQRCPQRIVRAKNNVSVICKRLHLQIWRSTWKKHVSHVLWNTRTQCTGSLCPRYMFGWSDWTKFDKIYCTRCNHFIVWFRDTSKLFKLDDLVTVIRLRKLRLINAVITIY